MVGLAAAGYCAYSFWEMAHAATASAHAVNQGSLVGPASGSPQEAVEKTENPEGVLGRIRIPALNIQAPVTDGIGKIELIRGVGHIPGTAFPGGLGTMALAGHRDTFFRNLQRVTKGMQIQVSEAGDFYRYVVDGTEIVDPSQVEVLEIGSEPSLVLITCYPFNYIGAAPRRFVVHARLISLIPDTQ